MDAGTLAEATRWWRPDARPNFVCACVFFQEKESRHPIMLGLSFPGLKHVSFTLLVLGNRF